MDVKGLGYLVSVVSVFLLGIVAWPKPGEPDANRAWLVAGMATSIFGMGLRYLAHRQQQKELRQAKDAAR